MIYLLTIDALTIQLENTLPSQFSFKYVTEKYLKRGNCYLVHNRVQLRKGQVLEKYYLHNFELWVDDCKVAMISTDCRQNGQQDSVKLTFLNGVFYTAPGWFYYLRIIEEHLPLRFKSFSYIEIAYDFQSGSALMPELWNVFKYSSFVDANKEVLYGPKDGKLSCSLLEGREYAFGKSVRGKDSTGKQVVVYGKSFEVERSHKEYILGLWKANEFDLAMVTERIEARASAKWLSKLLLSPEDLADPKELGRLFRQIVGDTFVFRKLKESYFDANRNKKTPTLTLIEFPDLNNEPLYAVPLSNNLALNNDTRNRIEAKNMVFRYIESGVSQDLTQLLYFSKSVQAPQNCNWPALFSRYAQQYEGRTTLDRMERIESFG